MTSIPLLESNTQLNIPHVGMRDATCLAGGYIFNCRVTSSTPNQKFSQEYTPTLGMNIRSVIIGEDYWEDAISITPLQRNAAIAQWWLDNCCKKIINFIKRAKDKEEDIAYAFIWWLTTNPEYIQVDGWDCTAWSSIGQNILHNIINKNITFKQAPGIETIPRPRVYTPPHNVPPYQLPPPLSRPTTVS